MAIPSMAEVALAALATDETAGYAVTLHDFVYGLTATSSPTILVRANPVPFSSTSYALKNGINIFKYLPG